MGSKIIAIFTRKLKWTKYLIVQHFSYLNWTTTSISWPHQDGHPTNWSLSSLWWQLDQSTHSLSSIKREWSWLFNNFEKNIYSRWANTIYSRNMIGQCVQFNHPFLQSFGMFLGECLCLVAFYISLCWANKKVSHLKDSNIFISYTIKH